MIQLFNNGKNVNQSKYIKQWKIRIKKEKKECWKKMLRIN